MKQCLAIYPYCKVDEMKNFHTNMNVHVARNSTVALESELDPSAMDEAMNYKVMDILDK